MITEIIIAEENGAKFFAVISDGVQDAANRANHIHVKVCTQGRGFLCCEGKFY